MDLHDLPLHADPFGAIFSFHRRVERQLGALARLAAALDERGVDARAAAAAGTALGFFDSTVAAHHEKEERWLLPLIERHLRTPTELARFGELRSAMRDDHVAIAHAWRRLRKPLQAIGEGVHRRIAPDEVEYLRALYALHLPAEARCHTFVTGLTRN